MAFLTKIPILLLNQIVERKILVDQKPLIRYSKDTSFMPRIDLYRSLLGLLGICWSLLMGRKLFLFFSKLASTFHPGITNPKVMGKNTPIPMIVVRIFLLNATRFGQCSK